MKNKEILQEFYNILEKYYKFNKNFEKDLYAFKVMLEKEEHGDYEQLSFITEIPEVEVEITENLHINPLVELFGAIFGNTIKEEIYDCSNSCLNCGSCECQSEEQEEEIEILDVEDNLSVSELSVDEKSGNVVCKQVETGDDYVDISISDDDIEVSIMVTGLDTDNHPDIKKMIDKVYGDVLRTIHEKN